MEEIEWCLENNNNYWIFSANEHCRAIGFLLARSSLCRMCIKSFMTAMPLPLR